MNAAAPSLTAAQAEAWQGVQRSWGGFVPPFLVLCGVTASGLVPEVRVVLGNTFTEIAIGCAIVALLMATGVVLYKTVGPRSPLYIRYDLVETIVVQAVLNGLAFTSDHAVSPVWAIYTLHCMLSGVGHVVFRAELALVLVFGPIGLPLVHAAHALATGDAARAAVVLVMALGGAMGFFYGRMLATRMRELTAERERLQAELGQLKVAEDRRRIARDLHDGLGTELAAIAWRSAALAERPGTEAVVDDLRALTDRATGGIDEIRSVVWALDAPERRWSEVTAYLRGRAQELATADAWPVIEVTGDDLVLPGAFTAHYVRFVLEAMRNAVAYGVGPIGVRLAAAERIEVHIANAVRPGPDNVAKVGSGRKNLAERAAKLGAELVVDESSSHWTIRLVGPRPAR